jgi:amino acid adenylation domain-containing protein
MAYLLWHYLRDSLRDYPDRPAIDCRGEVLTYAQLEAESNRMAAMLARNGIGPGNRVGLFMSKSGRSIITMLGVLKAGAAYVPIDPGAPLRRVAFILEDCAVRGLVTTAERVTQLSTQIAGVSSLKMILLANRPEGTTRTPGGLRLQQWDDLAEMSPDLPRPCGAVETDPAYLLYTSGSTGTPKGVILTHRNALTFVEWGAEAFAVSREDRLSNHAPLHFDLSVFDIYVAFRTGACVVMVPDEVALFPMQLARWIDAQGITVWYSVPSALTRLLLHGQMERFEYRRLRTVLYAGEVFPVKYLRGVMERFPAAQFFNLYGPTETNVCTYYQVPRPLGPEITEIPIGKACTNTEVFALDEDGRCVGIGETGELYVRGPSVMPGYWGMPEKSETVLLRNPLQHAFQERLYRTGDVVRLQADGNYSFIGRNDHMVKSRGYRIELGEIEQVLHQHEHVKEAVVLAVPDEQIGSRLVAAIAPDAEASVTVEQLQSFCMGRLPSYMVPESFTLQADLPKTSTGKTDRQALLKSVMTSRRAIHQ